MSELLEAAKLTPAEVIAEASCPVDGAKVGQPCKFSDGGTSEGRVHERRALKALRQRKAAATKAEPKKAPELAERWCLKCGKKDETGQRFRRYCADTSCRGGLATRDDLDRMGKKPEELAAGAGRRFSNDLVAFAAPGVDARTLGGTWYGLDFLQTTHACGGKLPDLVELPGGFTLGKLTHGGEDETGEAFTLALGDALRAAMYPAESEGIIARAWLARMTVVGLDGPPTGQRADRVVVDDPHPPAPVKTQEEARRRVGQPHRHEPPETACFNCGNDPEVACCGACCNPDTAVPLPESLVRIEPQEEAVVVVTELKGARLRAKVEGMALSPGQLAELRADAGDALHRLAEKDIEPDERERLKLATLRDPPAFFILAGDGEWYSTAELTHLGVHGPHVPPKPVTHELGYHLARFGSRDDARTFKVFLKGKEPREELPLPAMMEPGPRRAVQQRKLGTPEAPVGEPLPSSSSSWEDRDPIATLKGEHLRVRLTRSALARLLQRTPAEQRAFLDDKAKKLKPGASLSGKDREEDITRLVAEAEKAHASRPRGPPTAVSS